MKRSNQASVYLSGLKHAEILGIAYGGLDEALKAVKLHSESKRWWLEDDKLQTLAIEVLVFCKQYQNKKSWTVKNWNCEIQTTGGYAGNESDLDKLKDYIDEQLHGRDFCENTVQVEIDLMFWSYLDGLECRATADAIADTCVAIAF